MMSDKFRVFALIVISFMVAWILMLIPLPYEWRCIRPEWLALVLIYWIFALPQSVGIMTGWSAGLVMDILNGELLGQYALSMLIVAYLARLLRTRLRLFPFWQQAFVILVLVGFGDLVLLLVEWLVGHPPRTLLYWAPTVSSVLIWPWINRLLRYCEHKAFA